MMNMRDLTASEKCDLYDLGECPFCRGKLFFEGPHGGTSVTWYCAGCGAGFNLTPEPFRVGQLIHEPGVTWPSWVPAKKATPTPLQVRVREYRGTVPDDENGPSELDIDPETEPSYQIGAGVSDYEKLLAGVPVIEPGPGLTAIAQGTIAGEFREWPQVRPEMQQFLIQTRGARNWMAEAVLALRRAERDRKAACDYIVEASGGKIGCGEEPIRFLIASHQGLRKMLVEALKDKET